MMRRTRLSFAAMAAYVLAHSLRRTFRTPQSQPAGALALTTKSFTLLAAISAICAIFPIAAKAQDAGATSQTQVDNDPPLPADLAPLVTLVADPKDGLKTGDIVKITITATTDDGDDITVPTQAFSPFEVWKKNLSITPGQNGKRVFTFVLQLLSLEPGEFNPSPVHLRVVKRDGTIGSVLANMPKIRITSLIANEPNAQPKPATKPFVVMEDDYTLAYIGGALLAALIIAGLTLLISRWWKKREASRVPPPPPRPAWDIALEKLDFLRRKGPQLIVDGRSMEFVDGVSDALREYLGARYGFDGLESTTDEIVARLKNVERLGVPRAEIATLLGDCDLVKFAKMVPDEAQCATWVDGATRVVRVTMPRSEQLPPPTDGGPR